jgi:hypothetical protein
MEDKLTMKVLNFVLGSKTRQNALEWSVLYRLGFQAVYMIDLSLKKSTCCYTATAEACQFQLVGTYTRISVCRLKLNLKIRTVFLLSQNRGSIYRLPLKLHSPPQSKQVCLQILKYASALSSHDL